MRIKLQCVSRSKALKTLENHKKQNDNKKNSIINESGGHIFDEIDT